MSFESIPGQQRAKRMLQQGLRSGKVSHAYLFIGLAGTGRKQMAMTFAQALRCEQQGDDACGTCLECRKITNGNHPDLYWIQPDGASVKIEQIRELQRQFAYRSVSERPQIYIIEQADKMTVQAANSLLKFLEEPNARIVAILIAENGQALLPTIQSRGQLIPFTPADPAQIIGQLEAEGYPGGLVRCAARLTPGLEACRQMLQSNWFAETRNVVIQLGRDCMHDMPSTLITVQQKFHKSDLAEHIVPLMEMLVLWFKDMVHIQCNRDEDIVYIDQIEWMKKHAFSRDTSVWIRGMERAVETIKRLRYHVHPQLALEQCLIEIQEG